MGKHIIGLGLLVTCLFAGVSCRSEDNVDFSAESFSKVKYSRYQLPPLRRPRRPRGLLTGLLSGLRRVPLSLGERLPLSLGRRLEFHIPPPELPPLSFELRPGSPLSFKPRSGLPLSLEPRSGLPLSLEPRPESPLSLGPRPESPLSLGPRPESPRVPSPKQEPPLATQESEPSNDQPPSKTRGPQGEDENHEENHRKTTTRTIITAT